MADLLDLQALIQSTGQSPPTPPTPAPRMTNILMSPPVLIRGGLDTYIGNGMSIQQSISCSAGCLVLLPARSHRQLRMAWPSRLKNCSAHAPEPDLPLNYNYQDDPNVPIGQSWVYAPIIQNANYSQRSIRAWQFGLILNEGRQPPRKNGPLLAQSLCDCRFTTC